MADKTTLLRESLPNPVSSLGQGLSLPGSGMADKATLLRELRDIHIPAREQGWVLAPGWYALILLTVVVIALFVNKGRRRYQQNAVKREALSLLDVYLKTYQAEGDAQQFSVQVSVLLRRVALAYFPRDAVASLVGDAWLEFLNGNGKKIDFKPIASYVLLTPFQPKRPEYQENKGTHVQILYQCARDWICQRNAHV